jgi:ABC-type sugar transport system substrate-binding protein
LQATVDQQAFRQGYLGVTSALRLINGEPVPMEVVVDSKLVTPTSLK